MWVYRKTEAALWTVGYFDPDGQWHPVEDYHYLVEAAARVNYLNGGTGLRA